jgi:tRNA threonylcarbamoyladenosine biosynthesis protein TsaE
VRLVSRSPEDTRALGAAVAGLARPGDVVALTGDLGAGKTTFVQGFGRALGVEGPITSPTFTLVRTYQASLPLVHVDLYRLDRTGEVADLALGELLEEGGVALVEWGDVAAGVLGGDWLEVSLELGQGEEERLVSLQATGPSWAPRLGTLARFLAHWPRATREAG